MTVSEVIAALQSLNAPDAQVAIWEEDCNAGWYTPSFIRLDPILFDPGVPGVMIWTEWLCG